MDLKRSESLFNLNVVTLYDLGEITPIVGVTHHPHRKQASNKSFTVTRRKILQKKRRYKLVNLESYVKNFDT